MEKDMSGIQFIDGDYDSSFLRKIESAFNNNSKKEYIMHDLQNDFLISDTEKLIGILVSKIISQAEEIEDYKNESGI